jgi:hypothetical protein
MTDYSVLLIAIMQTSLTLAALTIPAISVAYFLIDKNTEVGRMSKVVGFGSISAIFLVICSLITLLILNLGYVDSMNWVYLVSILFFIGCLPILYVLLILAGFKREIPVPSQPNPSQQQIPNIAPQTSQPEHNPPE